LCSNGNKAPEHPILIEKEFNHLKISTASITSSKCLKRRAGNKKTEQEAKQALLESSTLATVSE
jgi:hypothetical protein